MHLTIRFLVRVELIKNRNKSNEEEGEEENEKSLLHYFAFVQISSNSIIS